MVFAPRCGEENPGCFIRSLWGKGICEKAARWGPLQLRSEEFNLHMKAFHCRSGRENSAGFFGGGKKPQLIKKYSILYEETDWMGKVSPALG